MVSRGITATRDDRGVHGPNSTIILHYSLGSWLASAVMVASAIAMALAIAFSVPVRSPSDRTWGVYIMSGMALLCLWLLAHQLWDRIVIADDGVTARRAVGSRQRIRWGDVRAITFSPLAQALRIASVTGTTIWVNRQLNGTLDLCDALSQHLPPAVLQTGAKQLDVFRRFSSTGHHFEPPTIRELWRRARHATPDQVFVGAMCFLLLLFVMALFIQPL